ncbi:MAG TPA: hypothetical protein VFT70_12425 [Nocardioides sp.]|nr:hypothetical protein [Nocardioides sp.]
MNHSGRRPIAGLRVLPQPPAVVTCSMPALAAQVVHHPSTRFDLST